MDKTVAILCRVNRGLLPFETALSAAEIPFHYVNRSGFFAQAEIKATLSYLGACLFPANYLISGMLHSDFHPTKYLPRTKIAARFKELKAQDEEISYWHLLTKEPHTLVDSKNLGTLTSFTSFVHGLSRYRDLPAQDALRQVLSALKVGDHYSEFDAVDNDPVQNLSDLLKLSAKYRSVKEFMDFTRRVAAASRSKRGVMLSTVHGFKGLEADHVYLVACQEGVIPHSKATDIEEEKNIFFTACSRPRTRLMISYSGQPSVFLKGIKHDMVESPKSGANLPQIQADRTILEDKLGPEYSRVLGT